MQIYGFNKTTLLDYPEHIAATVFTGGCNFRCPFCHNSGLVLAVEKQQLVSETEVFEHLQKRSGILDGLCITGGEPTLQSDLLQFIDRVKELGYLVKLDTNGYRPDVLEQLLGLGMLDYVAMDIKASKEKYAFAAGVQELDLARIEQSVYLLKNSGIPYEFRTTVVKGIHEIKEFEEIGSWLSGCRAYYLQAYRESENVLAMQEVTGWDEAMQEAAGQIRLAKNGFGSFTIEEMQQMAELARKYITKVELRGMD